MNRKQFFQKLLGAAVVITVAPKVLMPKEEIDFLKSITEIKPNRTPIDLIIMSLPPNHPYNKGFLWKEADIAAQLEMQKRYIETLWGVPLV